MPSVQQAQGSQVNADLSTSTQGVTPPQAPQKGDTLATSIFNQNQRKRVTFSVIFTCTSTGTENLEISFEFYIHIENFYVFILDMLF